MRELFSSFANQKLPMYPWSLEVGEGESEGERERHTDRLGDKVRELDPDLGSCVHFSRLACLRAMSCAGEGMKEPYSFLKFEIQE